MPRHQFRGRKRALAELPRLHPGIKYAATYFDASVHNPERLTLDVLQDGEKAGQRRGAAQTGTARASNYVSLQSMVRAPPGLLPAAAPPAARSGSVTNSPASVFDFTADVIVNTTGRVGGPDQRGHGRRVDVHGRHQGLAHRAGPPGTS